jgi:hypothetical protein
VGAELFSGVIHRLQKQPSHFIIYIKLYKKATRRILVKFVPDECQQESSGNVAAQCSEQSQADCSQTG